MRQVRGGLASVAALGAALALSACGVKQEAVVGVPPSHPFTVVLDRPPNATQAALYTALAEGAFRAGGLAVSLQTPPSPSAPLRLLAEGKADMAISQAPELLLARDRGTALVAIAALVQQPLASVIALPRGGVASIEELAGKRVGTAGTESQRDLLGAMLAHAGVPANSVKPVTVGFGYVPAMLKGVVQATFGGFSTYDALSLTLMHRHPFVAAPSEEGVPSYDELVLVVRARQAGREGEDLRAFLQALTRGEQAVQADPAAAAATLVKANPGLEPKLQLESIKRTLPLCSPAAGKPYGYQEPDQWEAFAHWMYTQRMLRTSPATLAPPFTNEFLPGQGP
jgi:putative hydroxymethylpyrimidine transport system substrate-binding protein